jgi:hypothetical protein
MDRLSRQQAAGAVHDGFRPRRSSAAGALADDWRDRLLLLLLLLLSWSTSGSA